MRKTRVLALVVASLVSTASFARAQAPAAGAQGGRHAMGRGMEGRRGGERGALRGLKLSDAEQAKVKAIHSRYAAEGKTLRESMKPAMQEARSLRQKGARCGTRTRRDVTRCTRSRLGSRRRSAPR
jgi:Spy/CpxP family protein refolding chaperone